MLLLKNLFFPLGIFKLYKRQQKTVFFAKTFGNCGKKSFEIEKKYSKLSLQKVISFIKKLFLQLQKVISFNKIDVFRITESCK